MDLNVLFCDETHVIEVALADTVEDMRRKVASAVGLSEDSFFDMSFGDEAMGEGADMTQLSAGDTILVKKSMKQQAIAALHALGETDLRPERLNRVRPEVACLLLQAEVATVIPNSFLSPVGYLAPYLADALLTSLDLSAESIVTHIGDRFLRGCTSLTSVDLSGLSKVTQVGAGFLENCSSLTTLDLPLNNVTQIAAAFLSGCTSLTALDLSPLSNVTQIHSSFLCDCKSLTTLDLFSLSNVTHIGAGFLYGCHSLASLDMRALSNVMQIQSGFLCDCKSLTTLDLFALRNVTHIGSDFLANCRKLTQLDLSPLSRITHIDDSFGSYATNFAVHCASLTSIYLTGCSSAVSNEVRKSEKLSHLIEERPKRSRDESPEQSQKRQRHA